jgi:hypothetical protein
VALAEDANHSTAATLIAAGSKRSDTAASFLVAELDDLTALIAKATAGRRRKLLV